MNAFSPAAVALAAVSARRIGGPEVLRAPLMVAGRALRARRRPAGLRRAVSGS
ncbi:hypothetical protein [Streptomyces sp. NPDC089799]|uniref:hypothetical protein n=1 Tax=Streptomyces sp. NPDC089799 TaxID=3155066 RepID=UPI00343815DB